MKIPLTTFSVLSALIALACIGWVLWRWLRASDEPGILVIRWIITALVLGFVLTTAAQAKNGFDQIAAVLLGAVGGLVMIFTWRQKFCDFVGDLFASLYTGGNDVAEPAPFYSIAEAKRRRGLYDQAVAAVEDQLTRFPTDFRGWMLLAEIQA
jgi:hypothetical protein